jgi:hypothetical protein
VKAPGREAYDSCFAALARCARVAQETMADGEMLGIITEEVIAELSSSLEDSTQVCLCQSVCIYVCTDRLCVVNNEKISLLKKYIATIYMSHDIIF